jgi:7-cyano-7-deazaguanine synthase
MNNMKHVVISLSGGMDSSTLLLRCLKEYDTCTAISFDYGQKHRVELERAQSLVDYINGQFIVDEESKTAEYPHYVKYRQIKLDGLTDLLNSALVTGGDDVPEGHYAEENMKATVVPNRNKIFASIVQAIALSIADRTGEQCDIAMGIHAGDHAIYPDCRQEFRDADDHAFRVGN